MTPINSKYEDVYFVYVDPKSKIKLNSIAIRPEIHPKEGFIEWEDTSRGGYASIKSIKIKKPKGSSSSPQKILIKTKEGDKIFFVQLNLKIYNERVREEVYNQPKYDSDAEVKNYYLTTDFHG